MHARYRLLLVDDDPSLRHAYARAFRAWEAVIAEDGQHACRILGERHDFDAIVSDVMMPGATGMELYRHVARRYPDLLGRFIFVTGSVGEIAVDRFLSFVRCPVLVKPFAVVELVELVETIVARAPRFDQPDTPPSTPSR